MILGGRDVSRPYRGWWSPYRRWWMGGCRLELASEPAVDGSARQHTHRGAIDPCKSASIRG